MRAKLEADPRSPRELVPGLDPKIEEIILRAIEQSPRERYATAKEMLADLEDPARVELRDRSARQPPLLQRLHIPRRAVGPALLVLVISVLLSLTWAMGHLRAAAYAAHAAESERPPFGDTLTATS